MDLEYESECVYKVDAHVDGNKKNIAERSPV